MFDRLDSPFDAVESPFDAVESPFDAVESSFDGLDRPFDEVFALVDAVKNPPGAKNVPKRDILAEARGLSAKGAVPYQPGPTAR